MTGEARRPPRPLDAHTLELADGALAERLPDDASGDGGGAAPLGSFIVMPGIDSLKHAVAEGLGMRTSG